MYTIRIFENYNWIFQYDKPHRNENNKITLHTYYKIYPINKCKKLMVNYFKFKEKQL